MVTMWNQITRTLHTTEFWIGFCTKKLLESEYKVAKPYLQNWNQLGKTIAIFGFSIPKICQIHSNILGNKEKVIVFVGSLLWICCHVAFAMARQRLNKICEQMALTSSLFPRVPSLSPGRKLMYSHWTLKHCVRPKNCSVPSIASALMVGSRYVPNIWYQWCSASFTLL